MMHPPILAQLRALYARDPSVFAPAGPQAGRLAALGWTLSIAGAVVFLVVMGLLLWPLWRRRHAPPVTYMIDGVQYVAVAAGGNFQINAPRGDEVLVFALSRPGADTGVAVSPTPRSVARTELSRR